MRALEQRRDGGVSGRMERVSPRLADVLGTLASATDLAAGVPIGTSVRTSLAATRLGALVGQRGAALATTYYVALLRHLGCTSYAHEAAHYGSGDDHDVLRTFEGTDPRDMLTIAGRALGLREGAKAKDRIVAIGRTLAAPGAGAHLAAAHCDQARVLAEGLGLAGDVSEALGQIYERYAGKGDPRGLAGDAIAPAARLLHVALALEASHRRGGRRAALEALARGSGKTLDPMLVRAATEAHEELFALLEHGSAWDLFLEAEPSPVRRATDVDAIALAFAHYADLKSPVFLGHSVGVARLAKAAGQVAGLSAAEAGTLYRAALLHDLGIVGVPNGIWEKPGPLDGAEAERARMHAYFTARVLSRVPGFSDEARLAALHHERCDGSGYPFGSAVGSGERAARCLAAADAYRALVEERPHRRGHSADEAAKILRAEAKAGALCSRAVDDVLAAAGHAKAPSVRGAHGLTEREVDVLVHVARGMTNKEVSAALGIAPRTVTHHLEHIYAKVGVSTRAAAALFAVRNELIFADRV